VVRWCWCWKEDDVGSRAMYKESRGEQEIACSLQQCDTILLLLELDNSITGHCSLPYRDDQFTFTSATVIAYNSQHGPYYNTRMQYSQYDWSEQISYMACARPQRHSRQGAMRAQAATRSELARLESHVHSRYQQLLQRVTALFWPANVLSSNSIFVICWPGTTMSPT